LLGVHRSTLYRTLDRTLPFLMFSVK
jgi:hypothetical protein